MILQDNFIHNLAAKGLRMDKRKLDEFRPIVVETGVIAKAEGSARVKIGNTEVIVGVKLDVGTPFPDKPSEGVLITNAEFSPIASPLFEKGPPREEAIELARVVDRGIRESKAIETAKLCIAEKEKVWMVFVDIHILNHFGNLIDASAMAAIAALLTAKMPEYDGEKVNYEKHSGKLPVKCKPVAVTMAKIGERIVVDASLEEEQVMAARLTATTKDDGNVCALQKGGTSSLTLEDIESMLALSKEKGKEIRKLL
ncbi:MAG: exosome complex protein Rrp42 [Candidatus Aenigmarchaeota archaeon]|nr:exosome complex protein Rrp42 [Candidatus Aenigmarchaeota archaeon]